MRTRDLALRKLADGRPRIQVAAPLLGVAERQQNLRRDEAACATCGEPCKRSSAAGGPYVYVGDGYSDRCAALAAERVFARDSLARYLDGRGVAYAPFEELGDVAAALSGPVERPSLSRGRKT